MCHHFTTPPIIGISKHWNDAVKTSKSTDRVSKLSSAPKYVYFHVEKVNSGSNYKGNTRHESTNGLDNWSIIGHIVS